MIVDTSAVVAILHEESEAEEFQAFMLRGAPLFMSAGSRIELSVVVARTMKAVTGEIVERLLNRLGIEIVSVTRQHAELAEQGYRRFGQGSGHPARLNFGDCFAYALSKASGEPLLFKGDDFAQTDVTPAIAATR